MESVFVFGASGHGKVVIDILERMPSFRVAAIVDDDPALRGKAISNHTVIGGKADLLRLHLADGLGKGIVAIGANSVRLMVALWLTENGFHLVNAIHPSAQISRHVSIGAGTVIMAGAVVNADVAIGSNSIVNTRSSIDHDCVVGDGVHVAPGVTLCGAVTIGDGTFVGAGSTIIQNVTVGRNVMIGAGATVVRDVPDGVLVTGTPGRVVRDLLRPQRESRL